jgi:multiple sugar transport system substrate-binding protein
MWDQLPFGNRDPSEQDVNATLPINGDDEVRHMSIKRLLAVVFATALVVAACGDDDGDDSADGGGDGGGETSSITIQAHQGNQDEADELEAIVERFNASQDTVEASVTFVPEADYASTLSGQSAGGELASTDIVEMDASFAFNYAWNGDLQPIDECVDDELLDDLLPSIIEQGTYAGDLWALGMFDSGLGLWASRSALEEVGARIPESPDDAWTIDEFDQILADLQAAGWDQPLDLKINYGQGEYYSYGFAPIIWSSGGDLIDRDTYETAEGMLNSPEAVAAMERYQAWHENDYVDDNEDDAAFIEGRSAISWVGHWETARYTEELGDDLVLVPLPDFGEGTRTGQGSWQWAIGADADFDAACEFMQFLMEPEQIESMTTAAGAIPARTSVAETYEITAEGGPGHLYVVQHEEGLSVPRPPHPSYQTISSAYNEAVGTIISGGDVQGTLDEAVAVIDEDLEANDYYPEP